MIHHKRESLSYISNAQENINSLKVNVARLLFRRFQKRRTDFYGNVPEYLFYEMGIGHDKTASLNAIRRAFSKKEIPEDDAFLSFVALGRKSLWPLVSSLLQEKSNTDLQKMNSFHPDLYDGMFFEEIKKRREQIFSTLQRKE